MFSSVQLLSRVPLFATPWTAASQASLSITNSPSLLKLMSIESLMSLNLGLPHCRRILYQLSHKRNPNIVHVVPIQVGNLSLLQQIFPTQESNQGSPALQADSLPTEL